MADINTEVRLLKKPGSTYPQVDDIFQVKSIQKPTENDVQDNQVLLKVKHLSIDASMRIWISGIKTYIDPVKPGQIMPAQGVGEVLHSKSKRFQKGDIVLGFMSWQDYMVQDAKQLRKLPDQYPNHEHFLGVLGIAGLTAYFGLFDIGKPKKGETVVVSAAAGSVGEIVVQLAKQHGCKVVGIAGTADKCDYITKILGADFCLNYKTDKDLNKKIKEICPEGIDVYYDNVGGVILDQMLLNINDFSRIVMCGAISGYNESKDAPYGLKNYMRMIIKKSTMQGFIVLDYMKRYPEALQFLGKLIQSNKLIFKQDIVTGIDQTPRALQRLLLGQNQGKVIVSSQQTQPKL